MVVRRGKNLRSVPVQLGDQLACESAASTAANGVNTVALRRLSACSHAGRGTYGLLRDPDGLSIFCRADGNTVISGRQNDRALSATESRVRRGAGWRRIRRECGLVSGFLAVPQTVMGTGAVFFPFFSVLFG